MRSLTRCATSQSSLMSNFVWHRGKWRQFSRKDLAPARNVNRWRRPSQSPLTRMVPIIYYIRGKRTMDFTIKITTMLETLQEFIYFLRNKTMKRYRPWVSSDILMTHVNRPTIKIQKHLSGRVAYFISAIQYDPSKWQQILSRDNIEGGDDKSLLCWPLEN